MPKGWRDTGRRLVRKPALPILALLVVLVGLSTAIVLRLSYQSTLAEGERRAENLAVLLEEQTVRNFQAVDLVLQGLVDALGAAPRENDSNFREMLKRRLAALPHVRALFVVGPDGLITHDTDYPNTPRVSLADRDYFKAHESGASADPLIGKPIKSRSVDRWFVSVSRRVEGPDGRFHGIVVAAVEPTFYEHFYSELGLGPKDAVSLLHSDGTLIARVPESFGQIGNKLSALTVFRHYPRRTRATYRAAAEGFDGLERIVSFRALADFPLLITVGLSVDALLATWRRTAAAVMTSYGLFVALSAVAAFLLLQRSREKRRAKERALLSQRFETLGQMTSGVSHDFKNILAIAAAGLALAEKYADDPLKVRAHIASAWEAINRGLALTSQLLSFAKRERQDLVTADANALLRSMEPMLRQAAGPHVHVTVKLANSLPHCVLDPAQFEAAILNLLLNARDAMSNGGAVEILTRFEAGPPGAVVVVVADSGPGIPPEHLKRVFEPFFTTKGERGTGLGLAQVYASMERVGGEARIASSVGQGTSVELRFRAGRDVTPT
jgi:two-component system, NtrC family, sensor kinase